MLGVCYYPEHWPEPRWAEDARRMRELGLSFVRVGEFAWSRLEPEPGAYAWDWLDRALDALGREGLRVVVGTPTATPPKWLVDAEPQILPVGPDGRPRGFGSRRHYCFTSPAYREHTRRIVGAIADRYGTLPAVAGWQTDNEYGCHDTARCYCARCAQAFRLWLEARHGTVGALNQAWGTVFWSQEYRSFSEIDLPAGTVTEPNPAQALDFARFASDQVRDYNRLQTAILRERSPGRFVTHNFMGFFADFDHYGVGEDLDLASWDSYPLGFTEDVAPLDDQERVRYARTGHPDIAAFHHDLYRRVGRGRFWVMEQQPGPVNWARHNPAPARGMVRLWTWEALAHGAEVVSYFRWRQAPFAQEQMHAGLNRVDGRPDDGHSEAARVERELAGITLKPPEKAGAALVYDYEADWAFRTQPQGASVSYRALSFCFYRALRELGLDVDVLAPGDPLEGYGLVAVPSLPILSDAAIAALGAFGGTTVFGPRTGSKTTSFSTPLELPPGGLQRLLPLRVTRAESLRPGLTELLSLDGSEHEVGVWRERVETDLPPTARFGDGTGAAFASGTRHYLAFWPTPAVLREYLEPLAAAAGLAPVRLPEGLRLRRRASLTFAFNSAEHPLEAPAPSGARFVLGGRLVEPRGLSVWTLEGAPG